MKTEKATKIVLFLSSFSFLLLPHLASPSLPAFENGPRNFLFPGPCSFKLFDQPSVIVVPQREKISLEPLAPLEAWIPPKKIVFASREAALVLGEWLDKSQ